MVLRNPKLWHHYELVANQKIAIARRNVSIAMPKWLRQHQRNKPHLGQLLGQGANVPRQRFAARILCRDPCVNNRVVIDEASNLIDMSIVAAYIQKSDLYRKANWDMATFGDEEQFPIEIYPAPKKVAPVVNAVVKQGALMTPIGGGVNIQARIALNSDRASVDTEGKIGTVRDSITFDDLAEGQWWWD